MDGQPDLIPSPEIVRERLSYVSRERRALQSLLKIAERKAAEEEIYQRNRRAAAQAKSGQGVAHAG
jgi:hypothetical protein